MEDSAGLQALDPRLQQEYDRLKAETKQEFRAAEGVHIVHDVLLERYCFIYVLMRSMEEDPASIDMQRYNQLFGLWLKIGSDLLTSYKEIYTKSIVEKLFVEKVMSILTEEVTDPDALLKIKTRFANIGKENASA